MSKLCFELVPGKGALPLLLGSSRRGIGETMEGLGHKISARHGQSDRYVRNCVQIEFDEDGLASFIGISTDSGIELIYRGRDILHLPSHEVFDLIKENEPECDFEYSDVTHLFRNQIITLWDADEQYDSFDERFPVWGQIGIGNENYLAAIDEIDRKARERRERRRD